MEYQRIYAKIDLDAVARNIAAVQKRIPPQTGLILVVKADAYGHGAVTLARAFEQEAAMFAVSEMNEALELRRAGIRKPILILGYTSPSLFRDALDHDVTLTMFREDSLKTLSEIAGSLGKCAHVHFAVDTGMARIGWSVSETSADEAARAARLPFIKVDGIFSHFAAADEADRSPSDMQREEFDRFVSMLAERGVVLPLKHINNSAATLVFDTCYDMVRLGIVIYGLYPSLEVRRLVGDRVPLSPSMSLITHISHIKMLPAHQGIGYGATYVTDRDVRVATIPVGYGDGYPRSLSGRGEVLIRGKRCPILGRICMDQMMVDVTNVPDAEIEDRVTLIGVDGDETVSVEELADRAGSFHYELVCGIARRVPRIYFRDGLPIETVTYI